MKEACPSKWSQSGEMSSEDTAAAFSHQPSLIAAYSSEPSSPVPARQEGRDVYIPNRSTPSSAREN